MCKNRCRRLKIPVFDFKGDEFWWISKLERYFPVRKASNKEKIGCGVGGTRRRGLDVVLVVGD